MVAGILAAGIVAGLAADALIASPPTSYEHPAAGLADHWESLAADGKWTELWWSIPETYAWRASSWGAMALAAATGLCWLAFLLHAAEVDRRRRGRLLACLAGVALGVLSIWPAVFFIYWQEYVWNLRESAELGPGLRDNILGVGLREEFAKLLCVLPLMPWLVAKRDEFGALMASACVGLGFAVEENAGYFWASSGLDTLGRYLTANPAHIALTGVVGLAVYRAIMWPREWGLQAVAVFGVAVLAHGLYDAMLSIEVLQDYAMLSTIIFALLVYQFFHELRELRARRRYAISLSATFLAGVSMVIAVTFVYLSATLGAGPAFDSLVGGGISLSLMVYLFLREMPETMVSV